MNCNNDICNNKSNKRKVSRRGRHLKRNDFSDLLDNVKDSATFSSFLYTNKLLPFAAFDTLSANNLLKFLLDAGLTCEPHAACIKAYKRLGFSGRVNIVYSKNDEFENGQETLEVDPILKTQYIDFISKNVTFGSDGIHGFSKELSQDYQSCGNFYFTLKVSTISGNVNFELTRINPTNVAISVDKKFVNTTYAISSSEFSDFKEKLRYLPKYPNFATEFDGQSVNVKTCLFHIKHGSGNYGRPETMELIQTIFLDRWNTAFLDKKVRGLFMPSLIMDVEDANPDAVAPNDNVAESLEMNFTNTPDNADPLPIMVMNRPFGNKEAKITEINSRVDVSFLQAIDERNEQRIHRAHGLPKILVGDETTTGFNADAYIYQLLVAEPNILNQVKPIENAINEALWQCVNIANVPQFGTLSLSFRDSVKEVIRKLQSINTPTITENKQEVN